MDTVTLDKEQLLWLMRRTVAETVVQVLPMLDNDPKLNRKEAAKFMGDCVEVFDTYSDRIPCEIPARRKYWRKSELIKFLASRTVLIES